MIAVQTLFSHPVQVQRGDLWQLGNHRLYCGDSTNAEDVSTLFDGESFALCFTSPPYSDQRTYGRAAFNWHELMCGAFEQMIANGKSDCHILINLGLSHKNRQVDMYWIEWLMECAGVGWPLFGWYVWDKLNGFPGEYDGRLAFSHEFVFHFNKKRKVANKWIKASGLNKGVQLGRERGGAIHRANAPDKIGQSHKIPDSVIRIHPQKSRGIHDNHPAVFPVALPEFMMQTWSQPNDIVYEPFCGSGTSIIAGENLQRCVYAMEINEEYCNLALQRWQEHTGQQAIRKELSAE